VYILRGSVTFLADSIWLATGGEFESSLYLAQLVRYLASGVMTWIFLSHVMPSVTLFPRECYSMSAQFGMLISPYLWGKGVGGDSELLQPSEQSPWS